MKWDALVLALVASALSAILPAFAAEPVDEDWLGRVSETIRRAEYDFTRSDDGSWSAPNRAQGLRVRITPAGDVEVVDRHRGAAEEQGGFRLALRLDAFGRNDAMRPAGPATTEGIDRRVDLHRSALSEWFANEPRGLKQGFTLRDRPASVDRHDAETVVQMRLSGGLAATVDPDGRAVVFRTGSGRPVLRYDGLVVVDAAGRDVPSRLALSPGVIRILIDDADAVYPLTVDPLISSPHRTLDGAQQGALFGAAVSTAGDVDGDGFSDILVGSPLFDGGQADEGRVFLFLGSNSGLSETADWQTDGGQAGADLGRSVAPAGDVNGDGYDDILLGAPGYDNGETDEGRAFLFLGSPTGPATTADWTSESDQAGARFGEAVGTAGDVNGDGRDDALIGAPSFDNRHADDGRAFLFLGTSSGLETTSNWEGESNKQGARFGASVSGAGDVNGDGFDEIIVGAPGNGGGKAFVHLGSALGTEESAAWSDSLNQGGAGFGTVVTTAGDVDGDGFADILVTAPGHDSGETDEGSAFVYLGSAGGPASSPSWSVEADAAGARLGEAAAVAGDANGDGFADIALAAPGFPNPGGTEGRVLVHTGSAAGLSASAAWTLEGGPQGEGFGEGLATAGDVDGDGFGDLLVGTPRRTQPIGEAGRVQVFLGAALGPEATPSWEEDGDQDGAQFGFSVASAGDVNGDGYGDVIVGARVYDSGQLDEGRAYLYLGSASGLAVTPSWITEGDNDNAFYGRAVDSAGDVNGDGFDDVIVGSFGYPPGGRAWIYHGSPAGLSVTADLVLEHAQTGADFGISVSAAGDVNGDGFGDVIVGAFEYVDTELAQGAAYAYHGSATGLSATHDWFVQGVQRIEQLGFSVDTAGDVNGDGYSDVVVGARFHDVTFGGSQGRALVFHGSAAGLSTSAAWVYEGTVAGGWLGTAVAGAGDVDGDGFGDVLVGAPRHTVDQSAEGGAFLFFGSSAGLSASPGWIGEGDQEDSRYGAAVSSAGDVNDDGFGDILVGAEHYDNGQSAEGRAFLYLGASSGPAPTPAWTAEPDQAGAVLGESVASAGDVNGDGFDDVIVGAPNLDRGQANEGGAAVYLGNDGGGLDRIPNQIRTAGGQVIGLLGVSDSETAFRITAGGRTAAGRGRVRLQWEAKPIGVPLDGSALATGAGWADTGAPSSAGSVVALDELAGGFSAGSVLRWRARVVSDSPLFPHSPWLSPDGNGRTETDLRTAGCDPTVPTGSPALTVEPDGLSWTALPSATGYDLVRGDLPALVASTGDFTASTSACLADDLPWPSLAYTDEPSAAGEGWWLLVRGVFCSGHGTYDSGGVGSPEGRDAEIDLSPSACP